MAKGTRTKTCDQDFIAAPSHGYVSRRPAPVWQEACLLGSGTVGCLLFGTAHERLILSHEHLFYPRHPPIPPVHMASHLDELRGLFAAGRFRCAAQRVDELARREGYDCQRWTDPLIPAAEVRLMHGDVRDDDDLYRRILDFGSGEATVRLASRESNVIRHAFASRADQVVVYQSRSSQQAPFNLTLRPCEPEKHESCWSYSVDVEAEPLHATDGIFGFTVRFSKAKGGWLVIGRIWADQFNCSDYLVEGYSRVVKLVVRVAPMPEAAKMKDLIAAETDRLLLMNHGYEKLLERHVGVHGRIYARVQLDLRAGADRGRPIEDLWEETKASVSPAWLEKIFDAGRYAILCSSGEWPPTLQGVWTGTWFPPWSSDYTMNGNVQAAIDSALTLNMPEVMCSLFNYVETFLDHMRENARSLYGARGLLLASRSSTHGLNNHFDAEWPMTFWTAGAAWIAAFYCDYWLHTGDEDFARRHALPFMIETARFFEDFLVEDSEGKWLFSPSYSPENRPANSDSQACVNATMDISAVSELLTNLIELIRALGESNSTASWEEMLARMPSYRINSQGAVAEWVADLEDQDVHRHCSHLYALFRMLPDGIAADPMLRSAFERAVNNRYKERLKGGAASGDVMAFGLAQLGLAALSVGQSEIAGFAIRRLARFYYPNAASCHDNAVNPKTGRHEPAIFNTDLSGAMPSLIVRSIIDSAPGRIVLMPAAREIMPCGRIEGVLLRKEITVKYVAWDNSSVEMLFVSRISQQLDVEVPSAAVAIKVNGRDIGDGGKDGHHCFKIACEAGENVMVSIAGCDE